jgi:hypothetical protein
VQANKTVQIQGLRRNNLHEPVKYTITVFKR